MAWNETTITIVGIIVSEVTHRVTASEVAMASFRVLSVSRRYDKDLKDYVDAEKVFLNVVCWRKLADAVNATMTKGDAVIVTGRLRNRDYELDGARRNVSEIDASAVGPNLMWAQVQLSRPVSARQEQLAMPEIVAPRASEDAVGKKDEVRKKKEEPVRDVVEAPF